MPPPKLFTILPVWSNFMIGSSVGFRAGPRVLAAVEHPDALAVAIDVDADRGAPFAAVGQLGPAVVELVEIGRVVGTVGLLLRVASLARQRRAPPRRRRRTLVSIHVNVAWCVLPLLLSTALRRRCTPSSGRLIVASLKPRPSSLSREERSDGGSGLHATDSPAIRSRSRSWPQRGERHADHTTPVARRRGAARSRLPLAPAFAAWEENARYPDPRVAGARPELQPLSREQRQRRAALHRRALERRAGLDGRLALPALERHPQQPHPALGRSERAHQRLSPAVEQFQRSRARPPRAGSSAASTTRKRITRTEHDGTITVLVDQFDGKPFNSPNDVVVRKSDGTIWFSDPAPAGPDPNEGRVDRRRTCRPTSTGSIRRPKQLTVAASGLRPNGLAFSPDEKILYLADNEPTPRVIRAYDVADDGKLANRTRCGHRRGRNDLRRLQVSTPSAISGAARAAARTAMASRSTIRRARRSRKILLPERCANLCFGGVRKNRLFMAASHSIYSLFTNTQGAI